MLNRRDFIRFIAIAATAVPISVLPESRNKKPHKQTYIEPWTTIDSVQNHLFPADKNSIGATDINALAYLQGMMEMPDFEQEKFQLIHNGAAWLNDLAKVNYNKKFIQLDTAKKEKILRRIENSDAGSRWLSTLLTYILEALLSDPIYDGNIDEAGWALLGHQAGFPQPPKNKKYIQLQQRRYRKTKA